ncbi:MAG: LysM peptidoglycan-binding domain-containing protein [Candidatus Rifleibacteriota bacterium]
MNKKLLVILVFLGFSSVLSAVTTHTFRSGDTLWDLAAKHYGDPTLYPVLLEVNGIDNPRTIQNGKVIIIPDKSSMQQIAKEKDPARKRELISQATSGQDSPVIPPGDNNEGQGGNTSQNNSASAESRTGEVDPNDTSFTNILKGPKVTGDKLIKVDDK